VTTNNTQSIVSHYKRATELLTKGHSGAVALSFDDSRQDLAKQWADLYSLIKDKPGDVEDATSKLITGQSQSIGLSLAMARCDDVTVFREFKRLLEFVIRINQGVAGYLSVVSVPNLHAGFLYMSTAVMALHHESWAVMQSLLSTPIEWFSQSERPLYSFGFAHPYLFHPEAFGRSATKTHDFYRKILNQDDLTATTGLRGELLLDEYLRTNFLMCLKGAQLIQQGQHVGMWADFGRFYAQRVVRLLDRAHADRPYGEGMSRSLGESPKEFFSELQARLKIIYRNFWGEGGNYLWESLTSWEPQ